MIALLLVALAICLIAVFASATPRAVSPAAARPAADPAGDDPVEMLSRYGTSDDAARLTAEGHGDDLAGLGYQAEEN